MDLIWDGFREALELIFSGDEYVYEVTYTSLVVSGSATAIALALGLSIAAFLAFRAPPGRTAAIGAFNAGLALPPVVVGLLVSIMLWRTGPLGLLDLQYSRGGIIIAQTVIATPVIAALSTAALQGLNPNLRLQVLALGASRWQAAFILFREARYSLLAALMAGFGAAISEVGATMMVGGNLKGNNGFPGMLFDGESTRTLTSATVHEVGQGHFETAIALSMILMVVILAIIAVFTALQQRRPGR